MPEAAAAPRGGRHQRRLRNYLLDRHFQLKYAGYFVGISVVLSVALGLILWRTSQELLRQSEEVVERGARVVQEGEKVSKVVEMNIVQDPIYGDNPALLEAFKEGDKKYTENLQAEQAKLKAQADSLAHQHNMAAVLLIVALTLFVVFVALMGIVVTHKVAGPIFKMKRQITDVAHGHLAIPQKLRKGDELVDFFDVFRTMVMSLRERQEQEIGLLDSAIEQLEKDVDKSHLEPLYELRQEMKDALN